MPELLAEACLNLKNFNGKIDAIVSYWDFPATLMLPTLRHAAGLATTTTESILRCEHKYWSRRVQQQVVPELIPRVTAFNPFAKVDAQVASAFEGDGATTRSGKLNAYITARIVRVLPNGQEVRLSDSNWLRESKEISLDIPPEIIPKTAHVEVKIYTGALAQVVEGLEKILRLPHG